MRTFPILVANRAVVARCVVSLLVCGLVMGQAAVGAGAADPLPPASKPHGYVPVPNGVAYIPDVTYCPAQDKNKTPLELDIAYPSKGNGPLPALVFFHGGGWVLGSRKAMTPYLLQAAEKGYVAVAVSYRLGAPFPAAVEDAKCAVRWLRTNASRYRIDVDRMGAVGYSAGGQLACLLGSTSDQEFAGTGNKGQPSSRVRVVVSWYGITDLESLLDTKQVALSLAMMSYLRGTAEARKSAAMKASPLRYASKTAAPTLLIHGDADKLVPIEQSRSYAAQLKKVGAEVSLLEVAKAGHNFTGAAEQEALQKMWRFLEPYLKPQAVATGEK